MNSKNSGTSDLHLIFILLNVTDKINLKERTNMLLYQSLAFTIKKYKKVVQK